MLWLVIALMTLIALALLAWPFVRQRHISAPRDAYDLTVYRDQLRELDRDVARGLISATEAEGARLEIQRRMLRLTPAPAAPASTPELAPRRWTFRQIAPLGTLGLLVPAAALALYASIGSPNLPSRPFAEANQAGDRQGQRIDAAITKLKERLEAEPNNLEGWVMLGRSLIALDRHSEAVAALKRAAALSGDRPEIVAALAESMIFEAQGIVTPEARQLFEAVREKNPMDTAALYYVGLAEAQAGNAKGALDLWETLAAATPGDAPWRNDLVALMKQAAAELGVEPKILPPAPPEPKAANTPGPSADEMAEAAQMAPDEQQAMIRSMVDGLAARLEQEPNDLDGWKRLSVSYRVLGEIDKALPAYKRVAELAPDNAGALADYARAILDAAPASERLPEESIALYRRALALDPKHLDALWFVGYAEATAMPPNKDAARGYWQTLLPLLPPGSAAHKSVEAALKAL